MKRVLVVCGTGMVTSTVVSERVRRRCEDKGIDVAIDQAQVSALARGVDGYDLIVSTTQVPSAVTTPSVVAAALITGIGADQVLDEIERHLTA